MNVKGEVKLYLAVMKHAYRVMKMYYEAPRVFNLGTKYSLR